MSNDTTTPKSSPPEQPADKGLDGAACSLLPCPFCGYSAKWIDRDGWGWDAGCDNKDCIAYAGFDWYLTKELIAPMWNRRENVNVLAPAGEKTPTKQENE